MLKFVGKFLIGALTGFAAIALIAALLLGWRLSRGPVALDFLTPLLQTALDRNLPGMRVVVGRTVLDWSDWKPTLPVSARQVRLFDPSGREIARVPRLWLRLGVRDLLQGQIVPTAIEVDGLKLALVRQLDGTITFGNQPAGQSQIHDFRSWLTQITASGPIGGLQRLTIRDAKVTLADRIGDFVWQTDRGNLSLSRAGGLLRASFDLPLPMVGSTWRLTGTMAYVLDTDKGFIRVGCTGINPSQLPASYENLSDLRRLRMPVRGQVLLNFTGGAGFQSAHVALESGGGTVSVPEGYPDPVPVDDLLVRGDWNFTTRQAIVERFDVRQGAFTASFHGRLDFGSAGFRPALSVEGEVKSLSLASLMALWPNGVSDGGREWIANNMRAAVIPEGTFRLDLPAGVWSGGALPKDSVEVRFAIEGASAQYLGELPPLTRASGEGWLDAHSLRVTLDQAVVAIPEIGDLQVRDGAVVIEPLHQSDKYADIRFGISGPAQAMLALLDYQPLGYPSEFGVSPADVAGEASGRAHLRLPTKKDVRLKEIEFDGSFELHRFGVESAVGGVPLESAELTLAVDRNAITGKGTGELAGAPATIGWVQKLNGEQPPTRFLVETTLDEEARAKLGVRVAPYVQGPVGVKADLRGDGADIQGGSVALDLSPAALSVAWVHWRKPAGETATASAVFRRTGKGTEFTGVTASGQGLRVDGRGEVGPSGQLRSLSLDRLVLGDRVDLGGSLRRHDGIWVVNVDGTTLDASRLIKEWLQDNGKKRSLPPFSLETARFTQILLTDNAVLSNATASGSGNGKWVERLELRADIPKKGPISLSLLPEGPATRKLELRAADGGFVLAALGVTKNIRGGELRVDATMRSRGAAESSQIIGRADMRRFQMRGVPFLAKLLTLASLKGVHDILMGEGLSFDRLELPFEAEGGIVRTEDARAVGSSLGITAHGSIDRKNKTLDVDGTLAPIYTLNSLLGRVPVVGDLLLRGKEGLIALRYSAQGSMSDPRVSVNPLSVLTPGFLRGIFDLMDAPKNPPQAGAAATAQESTPASLVP